MKSKIQLLAVGFLLLFTTNAQEQYADNISKTEKYLKDENALVTLGQLKEYKNIFGDELPRILLVKNSKRYVQLSDFESEEAYTKMQSDNNIAVSWFRFHKLDLNILLPLPVAKVCDALNIPTNNSNAIRFHYIPLLNVTTTDGKNFKRSVSLPVPSYSVSLIYELNKMVEGRAELKSKILIPTLSFILTYLRL